MKITHTFYLCIVAIQYKTIPGKLNHIQGFNVFEWKHIYMSEMQKEKDVKTTNSYP